MHPFSQVGESPWEKAQINNCTLTCISKQVCFYSCGTSVFVKGTNQHIQDEPQSQNIAMGFTFQHSNQPTLHMLYSSIQSKRFYLFKRDERCHSAAIFLPQSPPMCRLFSLCVSFPNLATFPWLFQLLQGITACNSSLSFRSLFLAGSHAAIKSHVRLPINLLCWVANSDFLVL